MPKKPHDEDPQYPFLSECVKGSALVETPNGIARQDGPSSEPTNLGAFNEKGQWRPAPDPWSAGNRTGE